MTGSSNFVVFNPGLANSQTDVQFQADGSVTGGLAAGIANPQMHNKLFHQASIMVAAIAEFIKDAGGAASDADLTALKGALVAALSTVGEVWEVDAVRSYTVPNGVLTAFVIGTGAGGINAKKVRVSVNGIRRESGVGKDFTFVIGENHVDFLWAPQTGDIIDIEYVAV